MNKVNWKDPLLLVSIALAITGGFQASNGFLSALAEEHPTLFGLTMMGVSIFTGILTTIKSFILNGAPKQ